jgi:iron complex transport system substrate-binding protein
MIAGMTRRQIASSLAAILMSAGALAEPAAAAPAAAPRRIVSFNICADQLVLALADRAQIAGLSPYADDPKLSALADAARGLRQLDWQAESVIALDPDLVLVGPRDRSVTQRMLRALGYRLAELDLVLDLDGARRQISEVAELVGHPERGAALLARLDAARERLSAAARVPARTALLVGHGGYAEGSASLAAALLAQAGFKPPAGAPAGLGGFVPLERLIVMRPDVLVMHSLIEEPADQGSVYLTHPALTELYPPQRRIVLPGRYTLCGGPALVAGLDYLADALSRFPAAPPSPR